MAQHRFLARRHDLSILQNTIRHYRVQCPISERWPVQAVSDKLVRYPDSKPHRDLRLYPLRLLHAYWIRDKPGRSCWFMVSNRPPGSLSDAYQNTGPSFQTSIRIQVHTGGSVSPTSYFAYLLG